MLKILQARLQQYVNCDFQMFKLDLESIIESEVSQKEKDKYHILTHIYGI